MPRFGICIAAVLSVLAIFDAGQVDAQASDGRMFGFQIGQPLDDYAADQLHVELFGYPYVKRRPLDAAPDFKEVEVLVTPITGTILGLRAIANFPEEAASSLFAQRLAIALDARFGPSHYWYGPLSTCPWPEQDVQCTSLAHEMDIYWKRIGDYVIQLNRYPPSQANELHSVQLAFAAETGTEGAHWVVNLFAEEAKQFNETARKMIVESEQDGVLRGID